MAKRWMGVAVVLAGLAGTAQAQNPFLTNQGRPAQMPEPVPFSQSPMLGANPPVASAPYPGMSYSGGQMPAGVPAPGCVPGMPADDHGHSLNGDTPNAWGQENGYDPGNIYT